MKRVDGSARGHEPADPDNFVLPARMKRLLGRGDDQDVRLYHVAFEDGARTHWHSHNDIQVLYGLHGRCVVVDRDGDTLELGVGDVVVIEAGEEHWHGAAPGGAGAHLAINLGDHTEWLDSSAGDEPKL